MWKKIYFYYFVQTSASGGAFRRCHSSVWRTSVRGRSLGRSRSHILRIFSQTHHLSRRLIIHEIIKSLYSSNVIRWNVLSHKHILCSTHSCCSSSICGNICVFITIFVKPDLEPRSQLFDYRRIAIKNNVFNSRNFINWKGLKININDIITKH